MSKLQDAKTERMREYMNGVWGLSYSSECDDVTMFYSCGYYNIAAKLLIEAGAVEPNCYEAKLMIRAADKTNDIDFEDAYTQCMADYQPYNCTKCDHVHYLNCIYYDDATKGWPCDGCGKTAPLIKYQEPCCTDPLCSCNNYSPEDTVKRKLIAKAEGRE